MQLDYKFYGKIYKQICICPNKMSCMLSIGQSYVAFVFYSINMVYILVG